MEFAWLILLWGGIIVTSLHVHLKNWGWAAFSGLATLNSMGAVHGWYAP